TEPLQIPENTAEPGKEREARQEKEKRAKRPSWGGLPFRQRFIRREILKCLTKYLNKTLLRKGKAGDRAARKNFSKNLAGISKKE
ncbi:MAG: hypothetical protein LBT22_02765, partial [Peptococcaceae bacterium]|nr:hypothetical protein [Peptococcaceae bacterium]